MQAYLCVYRQPLIARRHWKCTQSEIRNRPELRRYLRRYHRRFQEHGGRFYDWGDDPSFFAAEHFLGDLRRATWGVCRPDVRSRLAPGDFVVFFCAQQQKYDRTLWKYFYVGIGTVGEVVTRRQQIWRKKRFREYRKFYNLLLDDNKHHKEVIHEHHAKWECLLEAPYVIFDGSRKTTHFNVSNPLFVATYSPNSPTPNDPAMETWHLDDKMVRRLYKLVPHRCGGKILRTSGTGNAHRHMNFGKLLGFDERVLKRRRRRLIDISEEIALS